MKWCPNPSRWLNESEMETVLQYAKQRAESSGSKVHTRMHMFVSIALQSGLRVSEMCNLRVRDCLLDGFSFLRVLKGKGAKTRNTIIPLALTKQIQDYILQNQLQQDDFLLISSHGKKYTRHGLRYSFMTICKQALGKSLSTHATRHSYASKLYRRTKDLLLIKNQLGHSSTNTSAIYAHASTEETIDTLNNIFR